MKSTLTPAFIFLIVLFACSSSNTVLTGTWKTPTLKNIEKPLRNILVVAMVDNIPAKATIESDLAAEIRISGIMATRSMDVFPPNFVDEMNDREKLLSKIREQSLDGILTVCLLDEQTESRYVPGVRGYAPYPAYGYYGNFWGYFSYWYPRTYTPGYYINEKTYFIETNLYDAKSGDILWSAQSETYSPDSLLPFSSDLTGKIARELREEDLI
jgi:hypothetical protein